MWKQKQISVLMGGLALFGASHALAEPITLSADNVGESFSIDYDGFTGDQGSIDSLSAEAVFTLIAVDGETFTFDYSITNTGETTSRVTSFALNTNPDIIGAESTGDFSFALVDSSNPNGIGSVDACFKSNRSGSCAGNGGGLTVGQTGTGTLSLDFLGPIGAVSFSDFFIRYQGIEGLNGVSSASGTGTVTSSTTSGASTTTSTGGITSSSGGSSGTPVPEPGMLGLLGFTLIGLGYAHNRRRRKLRA